MSKKSIKKNYLYNTAFQILKVIIPIFTAPYIARVLGAEGNGIYGFTISVATYFILLGGIGIDLYGQREIAFHQSDKEKRSNIFWELFILKIITMSISAVIFALSFGMSKEYGIYYQILLIEIIANMFDISWFYQGIEDFRKTAIRNILIKILSIISIFLFVKTANDTWIYVLIYACTTLIGSISLWFGLGKHIQKPKNLNFKKHLRPALAIFLPQIAVQIYTVLDKTMIGWITNDMNEVGYYEQSQKIIKILLALVTSLGTVMLPRIANCFANNDFDTIKNYMKKTFQIVLMAVMPLMFGIIAVANRFVPIFFGDGYDNVVVLLQLLSTIVLFIGLSGIIGTQYLLPTKRQKEYTTSIIAGAVTNIVLNSILIYFFKSTGAAIATVIAELVVTLVQIRFVWKELQLKNIIPTILKYLSYSLIMFAICLAVNPFLPNGILGLTIQSLIGASVYVLILLITHDNTIKILLQKNKGSRKKGL